MKNISVTLYFVLISLSFFGQTDKDRLQSGGQSLNLFHTDVSIIESFDHKKCKVARDLHFNLELKTQDEIEILDSKLEKVTNIGELNSFYENSKNVKGLKSNSKLPVSKLPVEDFTYLNFSSCRSSAVSDIIEMANNKTDLISNEKFLNKFSDEFSEFADLTQILNINTLKSLDTKRLGYLFTLISEL